MDQNIVRGTQHRPGHTQGKADLQPCLNRGFQLKNHAAGGYIPGHSGNLSLAGRQHYGQRQRKTHRTAHFLPLRGRMGTSRRER